MFQSAGFRVLDAVVEGFCAVLQSDALLHQASCQWEDQVKFLDQQHLQKFAEPRFSFHVLQKTVAIDQDWAESKIEFAHLYLP